MTNPSPLNVQILWIKRILFLCVLLMSLPHPVQADEEERVDRGTPEAREESAERREDPLREESPARDETRATEPAAPDQKQETQDPSIFYGPDCLPSIKLYCDFSKEGTSPQQTHDIMKRVMGHCDPDRVPELLNEHCQKTGVD